MNSVKSSPVDQELDCAGRVARRAYFETICPETTYDDPWRFLDDNARRPWIEAARAARAI